MTSRWSGISTQRETNNVRFQSNLIRNARSNASLRTRILFCSASLLSLLKTELSSGVICLWRMTSLCFCRHTKRALDVLTQLFTHTGVRLGTPAQCKQNACHLCLNETILGCCLYSLLLNTYWLSLTGSDKSLCYKCFFLRFSTLSWPFSHSCWIWCQLKWVFFFSGGFWSCTDFIIAL